MTNAEKLLLKNRKTKKVFLNVTIEPEVFDRITQLADKNGVSKGDVVSSAVKNTFGMK